MTVVFENPVNGYRVTVDSFTAWLWTALFGPFFFLFRGSTLHFFVWWLVSLTAIGPFIYPFFAASILRRMYYERGYRVVEQGPTSMKAPMIVASLLIAFTALLILLISGGTSTSPSRSEAARSPQRIPEPPSLPTDDSDSERLTPASVVAPTPVIQNTSTATLRSEPTQSPTPDTLYFIQGIAAGDTLNVRTGPGANFPISVRLPSSFEGIRIIGASVMNDTTEWVPIAFGDQSGWVARRYLEPQ